MTDGFDVQFLVVGGGPGGLQLGYGLQRIGADYRILEAGPSAGTFFQTKPRFRRLISFNKRHNLYDGPEIRLRWDWNSLLCDGELNFTDYSSELYPHADDLCRYFTDFADRFVPNIEYGVRVARIGRPQDSSAGFEVKLDGGETIRARVVILATGMSRPHTPDIAGFENVTETYEDVDLDASVYDGQRVLILGKGNSAFEVADHLLGSASLIHLASPSAVRFAWKTQHSGDLPADSMRLLDTHQLGPLTRVLDCSINEIRRDGDRYGVEVTYSHAEGEVDRLEYDRVIACTGFAFDSSILGPACELQTVFEGRFPELEPNWEVVGQPDLFVCGTLMQSRDFRTAATGLVGGFRYSTRALFHMLRERYLGVAYPSRSWSADAVTMIAELLPWICRTSALWAQFGHLCDAVVIDEQTGRAEHYKELPVDYVRQGAFGREPHVYQVTFESGACEGDIVGMVRRPGHAEAHRAPFLHPVIRRLRHGEVVEEHHMLEDLRCMWSAESARSTVSSHDARDAAAYHEQEHVGPLREFFARHLEPIAVSPKAGQA